MYERGAFMFYTEYDSPLGPLLLTSDGKTLTGLWMETQPRPPIELLRDDDSPLFARVKGWLDDYFRGEIAEINFPLSPDGTDFQRQVWNILLTIPYGKTTTYGTIAKQIAPHMSAQAVGQAVGRNPISIIIPCHRVVGTNGKLTGYTGGLDKKIWLLRHEEVIP